MNYLLIYILGFLLTFCVYLSYMIFKDKIRKTNGHYWGKIEVETATECAVVLGLTWPISLPGIIVLSILKFIGSWFCFFLQKIVDKT